jgi:hypothetical protein
LESKNIVSSFAYVNFNINIYFKYLRPEDAGHICMDIAFLNIVIKLHITKSVGNLFILDEQLFSLQETFCFTQSILCGLYLFDIRHLTERSSAAWNMLAISSRRLLSTVTKYHLLLRNKIKYDV